MQNSNIKSKTADWNTSRNGVKYFFLYNYYPTNLEDFEATDEEWQVRNLVWNFKNDVNRIPAFRHEAALNVLLPKFELVLRKTFGSELSDITLVCIPASSKQKNIDRYEEFSRRLCEATGMANAYPHIRVVGDATPKHDGGAGVPLLGIDDGYFRGRNVLLFDDVTTTGRSLERFDRIMRGRGATVIGGLCIAKTKHERGQDNPIDSFDTKTAQCSVEDQISVIKKILGMAQ